MEKHIFDTVNQEFKGNEQAVTDALSSITLDHVMGGADNLENTHAAILKLAKGDVQRVVDLVAMAKIDFRDVLMQVS